MFVGSDAVKWLQTNLSGFLTPQEALAIGERMLAAKYCARRALSVSSCVHKHILTPYVLQTRLVIPVGNATSFVADGQYAFAPLPNEPLVQVHLSFAVLVSVSVAHWLNIVRDENACRSIQRRCTSQSLRNASRSPTLPRKNWPDKFVSLSFCSPCSFLVRLTIHTSIFLRVVDTNGRRHLPSNYNQRSAFLFLCWFAFVC